MVEMREFKQVVGKVVDELIAKKRLKEGELGRGVIETA
jgi:hypothetical protein